MKKPLNDLSRFVLAQQRAVASIVGALLLFNGLVVVNAGLSDDGGRTDLASDATDEEIANGTLRKDGSILLEDGTIIRPDGTIIKPGVKGSATPKGSAKKRINGLNTKVFGVSDDEITVVYYWKGERTMSSPYITGTPAEGANLDEALAFREYLKFINKHDDDGTKFMGIPIDLHGRKLKGIVLEAGNGDFSYAQTAEKIAEEVKPFAAISSHGGLSTYICDRLAEAKIMNLSTYDLGGNGGNMTQRTNGYCVPNGLTWERQVDLTVAYLKDHMKTKYKATQDRVYGVIYSLYPGMKDSAPAMIAELRAAGIPIPDGAVYKIPADLATSQQQGGTIVGKMKEAGVNTLIMPEANSPLNMTHQAQINGWDPDYYVWPCSGQDSAAMVRLFNQAQWAGAEGLTCWDEEYNPDVTNSSRSRQSEWYKQYKEVYSGSGEPPSPAPIVYQSMAQLVAGISYAGRSLTPSSFKAALGRIPAYRYDAVDGVTKDGSNMLMNVATSDRSWIADCMKVRWDATKQESGQTAGAGNYAYPEDQRYSKASQL